jgi:C1A family cysteine protease
VDLLEKKKFGEFVNYVKTTGPLSVCLSAVGWEHYQSGVVETCSKVVNHCVQAVGVDDSEGGYWKVRNSYGADWGEGGYIRLAYGQNTCFITRDPTYTDTYLLN